MQREIPEPTLLSAIIRYWWLAVGLAVGVGLIAAAYAATIGGGWSATSSLVVERPRQSQVFLNQAAETSAAYVASQAAILESSSLAERSLTRTESELGDLDIGVSEVLSSRTIIPRQGSNLIEIEVTNAEPEVAIVLANSFAYVYEQERISEATRGFAAAISELDALIALVEDQIEDIAQDIESQTRSESNIVDEQIQESVSELLELLQGPNQGNTEQLAGLLEQLQTLQLIRALQADDPELTVLVEEKTQAFERRGQLLLRRDQVAVDSELASSGVASISPAMEATPTLPVERASAMGVFAGAVLGAGVAYLLTTRRRRFSRAWEPGSLLSVPLIAEVPDFDSENLITPLPARDVEVSAAAESYRFAAAALSNMVDKRSSRLPALGTKSHQKPLTLAFTSPVLGDGKTTTIANVAFAAVTRGLRVLLIDCDFGDPTLTRLLTGDVLDRRGLTDLVMTGTRLSSAVSEISTHGAAAIDFLGRGTQPITAPDFFRKAATTEFFNNSFSDYDLVLLDSPPIVQVAYTTDVVNHADAVVFVIRHNSFVRHLEEAADRLHVTNAQAISYIYNAAPLRSEMKERKASMRNPLGTPDGPS